MDSELNLAKAMKLVRQNEAVKQHTNQLQDDFTTRQSADLAIINKRPLSLHKKSSCSYKDNFITRRPKVSPQGAKPCFCCGKAAHPQGSSCPASGVTCKRCKRKGHFDSQCFSTTVRLPTNELPTANEIVGNVIAEEEEITIDPNELSLDTAFLDAITSGNQMSPWTSTIFIEG